MSVEKYSSEPRNIEFAQELVYEKLSNLKNLEGFLSPEKLNELSQKQPELQSLNLEEFTATEESCSFKISPLGKITISVVEKVPYKTIKIKGDQSVPFQVTFWIQLLPVTMSSCKMKLTLHAELSVMIKMMVGSHLEKGINQIADLLSEVNYNNIE